MPSRFNTYLIILLLSTGVAAAQMQPPEVQWTRYFINMGPDNPRQYLDINDYLAIDDSLFLLAGLETIVRGQGYHFGYLAYTDNQAEPLREYRYPWENVDEIQIGNPLKIIDIGGENICVLWGGAVGLTLVDRNGEIQWTQLFRSEYPLLISAYDFCWTGDGYAILAREFPNGGSWSRYVLFRTDAEGELLWYRSYDYRDQEGRTPRSILQTKDGGFLLCGSASCPDYDDSRGIYLIRTDAEGEVVWEGIYHVNRGETCSLESALMIETDEAVLLSRINVDEGRYIQLLWLDDGEIVHWSERFFIGEANVFGDLVLTPDGGFMVAFNEGRLVRFDGNGRFLYEHQYLEWERSEVYRIRALADGGYGILGKTKANPDDEYQCCYLMRLAPEEGQEAPGEDALTPGAYELLSAYPNPFNSSVTIHYSLPEAARVHLGVFAIDGRQMVTLLDKDHSAGQYSVIWKAADVPAGIYIARLQTASISTAIRLVNLR